MNPDRTRPRQEDTRSRILALLCSSDRTAGELTDFLGISTNAVREHLGRLESEGLVEFRVVRRGVGKPAHQYHLTVEGTRHISSAAWPLLGTLLAVIHARFDPATEDAILRDAGRLLARQQIAAEGPLTERIEAAIDLLNQLGGAATLAAQDGVPVILGSCCPLRSLVSDHPRLCTAVEALLQEYIGVTVEQRCDRNHPPTCRLAITGAA